MKKQTTVLVLFFLNLVFLQLLSIPAKAQTVDSRIQQIKAWYKEVVDREKSPLRSKAGSDIEVQEGVSFPQFVNRYVLRDNYELVTLKFEGWEWSCSSRYYYKDGDLFFVYIAQSDILGDYQFRIYYSSSGRAIRVLKKSDEDGVMSENEEIFGEERDRIVEAAGNDLAKGLRMLIGR